MSLIETCKMSLGCGDSACVSKTNRYFCSTSCKKAAIRDKFINDHTDIEYQESGFLLTLEAHERLFTHDQPTILEITLPPPDAILGCGDYTCVSKKNPYFCSRSCKNAAIRDNLIDDHTDINYEVSNLLLTTQAHKKLFS